MLQENKIIIVFDLGPGDGGKGSVIHKLSCHHHAHTIIKVGGAQGSHGVSTKKHEFSFSQWGCGTFEGVKTHITPLMVASPEGLLNEADALRYHGLTNAFDLLTIDRDTICSTPYHGIVSRIKEISRGTNPRGTIGTGVGEAFRDKDHESITAGELQKNTYKKLSKIRDAQISKIENIIEKSEFLNDDKAILDQELSLLKDGEFLNHNADRFKEAGKLLNIVDDKHISTILQKDGVAIVESSHGILTDNKYGFQPHTSAIRTLPSFSHDMLIRNGFAGNIVKLGVHRAYTVRHGAGPMPTADPTMNNNLFPGSRKDENRYQGKIRVGPLDFVLLKYAVDVCGGPNSIDGLAITWFDQISQNRTWEICDKYYKYDREYFKSGNTIKTPDEHCNKYQTKLCSSLLECKAVISSIDLPNSIEEQCRLCDRIMRDKLGIPIHLLSFGPTDRDKIFYEDRKNDR